MWLFYLLFNWWFSWKGAKLSRGLSPDETRAFPKYSVANDSYFVKNCLNWPKSNYSIDSINFDIQLIEDSHSMNCLLSLISWQKWCKTLHHSFMYSPTNTINLSIRFELLVKDITVKIDWSLIVVTQRVAVCSTNHNTVFWKLINSINIRFDVYVCGYDNLNIFDP